MCSVPNAHARSNDHDRPRKGFLSIKQTASYPEVSTSVSLPSLKKEPVVDPNYQVVFNNT